MIKVGLIVLLFASLNVSDTTASPVTQNGSLVITGQSSSVREADSEWQASADWAIEHVISSNGIILIHLEGATTASRSGISRLLPVLNADIGSVSNETGKGGIQLSELYWAYQYDESLWHVGLIDVSNYSDQSKISSDENEYFLGSSFTGNPTIHLPDYTFGISYNFALNNQLVITSVLSLSHGLGDNSEYSYGELINTSDKGVFVSIAPTFKNEKSMFSLGAWVNGKSPYSESGKEQHYGGFVLTEYYVNTHNFSIRAGISDGELSGRRKFLAISYANTSGQFKYGLAVAKYYYHASTHEQYSPNDHIEGFISYTLSDNLIFSPNIQWVNYRDSKTTDSNAVSLGIRLTSNF